MFKILFGSNSETIQPRFKPKSYLNVCAISKIFIFKHSGFYSNRKLNLFDLTAAYNFTSGFNYISLYFVVLDRDIS